MLRITAGEHRGRKLKVPKVEATRPLVERAREGLFNHLQEAVHDAVVWDIYAGSGILGLEALSRGAGAVLAVEFSRDAVRQIEENAALLRVEDRHRCLRADVYRLPQMPGLGPAPNLLFFDPPYDDFRKGGKRREKVWQLFLDLSQLVAPGGCAVVHTPRGILQEHEIEGLSGLERRDYSNTSLYWWHRPTDANA
ncbi:MAG: 16S rRNA (guanine(966)-N(2))-methyltransferase RsmD [Planctomycetota bacterium]